MFLDDYWDVEKKREQRNKKVLNIPESRDEPENILAILIHYITNIFE